MLTVGAIAVSNPRPQVVTDVTHFAWIGLLLFVCSSLTLIVLKNIVNEAFFSLSFIQPIIYYVEFNQEYKLVNSPQSIPPNAVRCTIPGVRTYYAAVAHTEHGNIPGRGEAKRCWYSFDGAEYCTADFSWITAPNSALVRNTGCPPPGAIGAGYQFDDGCTYYAAVTRSQWGMLHGKAKDSTCWYPFNGKEYQTSRFYWIVIGIDGLRQYLVEIDEKGINC